MRPPITPEFSRPIRVEDLETGENVVSIDATAGERAALAARFGLMALDRLAAELRVTATKGTTPTVHVAGTFVAEATQACVITLEPVKARIESEFALTYGGTAAPFPEEGAIELTLDGEDPPEPIVNGVIDLGEAVAEHLALELDPFPRAPGAKFDGFSSDLSGPPEAGAPSGPFAVLAKLKPKL
jgi:uncharacterized metal-binding protein YceD (DUF177 family)